MLEIFGDMNRLDGYLKSPAYQDLEEKLNQFNFVMWNVGVGPTACSTRAISSITGDVKIKRYYDHVIEVDMKRAAAKLPRTNLSNYDKLHLEVAEKLRLFYHNKYVMVDPELLYYTYDDDMKAKGGMADSSLQEQLTLIVPQIIEKLWSKKYLLVVENIDKLSPIELGAFTNGLWFPPPSWKKSFWLVSTTSQDVYNHSKPHYGCVVKSFTGDDVLMLTLYSLKQAAMYISRAVGKHEDGEYWHRVAIQCFHYAAMLLIPYSSEVDNDPPAYQFDVPDDVINSDKLIHHWASQGILPVSILKQSITDSADGCHNKYNGDGDDIYQVGNVILEAFQEYSLLQLPSSPAKQGDEASKTAAHFLAYHGLIAEHLKLDALCEDNNQLNLLERTQWISHAGDQGWCLIREWLRGQGSSGPTALVIKHCSQQSKLFTNLESDHFFAKLPCLRALDLSYTPIKSLPPSICYLQQFRYLSLRGCYNLTSPFSLPNTEIILNLLFFDLSYSSINTFHCDFFYSMTNLQALVLVMCSNLEELPPSIAGLSSLRSFSLIGSPNMKMKRLSLRGCRKLEYVDITEVGALEELDLSATAIKELPDSIPNLPHLKLLLLLGLPSLRRFPWHKLQRLPNVFCLDQCSNRIVNHSDPSQGAQVCISDSRLFYSFNDNTRYLVRAGKLLNTFYVRVTSCKATTKKMQDEQDMVMTNTLQVVPPAYDDVNRRYLTAGVSMVSMDDVPPCRETERHVEISAADRYPHGLKHLLQVTKSISMWDDTHVSCLSDLSDLDELEDCKLRWCHKTAHVFKRDQYVKREKSENMRNAFVSHLKSLTHFYIRSYYSYTLYFYALKHLVLEHCPRLEGVVPRDCGLPSLETLDILFCYNLKAIFYENNDRSYSGDYVPSLRRIRLQELPLLEHLHVDDPTLTAPEWKELHVRGCWSLRRLPRFRQQPNKPVEVSGERAWWENLRWDGTHSDHAGSYKPMLPPAFASRRERVVIKSYLR